MLLSQKKSYFNLKMLGALVLFMCFSLAQSAFCQSTKPPNATLVNRIVAVVNDGIITQVELDQAVNQFKNQLKQQHLPMPNQLALEKKTLQQLIIRNIALQMAKRLNITVSADELNAAINGIAANNKISLTQFKSLLKTQNISYAAWQENIKTSLIITKLQRKTLFGSLIVTPAEIDSFLAQHKKAPINKRYNVSQLLISLPDKPTSADIAKLKQKANAILAKIKHGLSFAKAAIQYSGSADAKSGGNLGWKSLNQLPTFYVNPVMGLQPGQIAGPIQTDSGFILIKLNAEKSIPAEKHMVTQYHVRKILIDVTPIVSDTKAKQIIDNIATSAQHGENFSELAKVNSKDTNTAKSGGDLGWVSLDMLDPTMGHVIENTPVNHISEPFKLGDGWAVIKVAGKREHDDSVNFARRQAQQTIFEGKANKASLTWKSQLVAMATVNILVPDLKPN